MTITRQANRLTEADEERITAALAEAVRMWADHPTRRDVIAARIALARVGAHAIGCTAHDLRDVELDWIAGAADLALSAVSA